MSDSDNPSSPKKEEMDVSENGDAAKAKEDSDQEDSKAEEPSKPAKKEEANEESEEEEDEEEPPLGLLERPVELTSGKREKKKVERLEVTMHLPNSERKKVEIPEGKGVKLGECPRIEFKINHTKAVDLKPLHRLLYNKAGANSEVKKNIRLFSGFTCIKGDKEYEKRVTSLTKFTVADLKSLCEVLDIERSGTKQAIVDRIMNFLMKPTSSGLKVPTKKKRKSKGGGDADKKGVKRKRAPKKKDTKSKSTKEKDLVSDISDSDDIEDLEEDDEEEKEMKPKSPSEEELEEEEEEEEEDEPPKKKAKAEKKSPAKKETPKAKKQNGKQEKTAKAEKKEPKKKKKALDSDEDSDSDDEPLVPKQNEPPPNSELKDVIKKILDGANLEEVTMKTVVKQVYEKYPSFDLTDRKDFIKTTVREIIS